MSAKKEPLSTPPAAPMPRPRSIFDLRDEPIVAADLIPAGSAVAQIIAGDGSLKASLLKPGDSEMAEAILAIQEMAASAAQMKIDMGDFAPDAPQAAAVFERHVAARDSNTKAQALAKLTAGQEDVANHDLASFLQSAADDVKHADIKKPGVARHYPHLMKYDKQRRDAISDGIARKQAEKLAEKQAAGDAAAKADKKSA